MENIWRSEMVPAAQVGAIVLHAAVLYSPAQPLLLGCPIVEGQDRPPLRSGTRPSRPHRQAPSQGLRHQ